MGMRHHRKHGGDGTNDSKLRIKVEPKRAARIVRDEPVRVVIIVIGRRIIRVRIERRIPIRTASIIWIRSRLRLIVSGRLRSAVTLLRSLVNRWHVCHLSFGFLVWRRRRSHSLSAFIQIRHHQTLLAFFGGRVVKTRRIVEPMRIALLRRQRFLVQNRCAPVISDSRIVSLTPFSFRRMTCEGVRGLSNGLTWMS